MTKFDFNESIEYGNICIFCRNKDTGEIHKGKALRTIKGAIIEAFMTNVDFLNEQGYFDCWIAHASIDAVLSQQHKLYPLDEHKAHQTANQKKINYRPDTRESKF